VPFIGRPAVMEARGLEAAASVCCRR